VTGSAEVKRCVQCKRPRDNGHQTLCPICQCRKTLAGILDSIDQLGMVK
jgi:hypothetical protein